MLVVLVTLNPTQVADEDRVGAMDGVTETCGFSVVAGRCVLGWSETGRSDEDDEDNDDDEVGASEFSFTTTRKTAPITIPTTTTTTATAPRVSIFWLLSRLVGVGWLSPVLPSS